MPRTLRRWAAIPVLVAAMIATIMIAATPAHADAPATVGNTDGDGLNVRQGPNTSSAVVNSVQTGDVIQIACQAYGESVTNTYGFTSNIWDYSTGLGGYVADAYMSTGHDGRIPGIPECDDSSNPPPGNIVPLQQNQGQTTQWEDCGPTSVVTALLAQGITPHGWNVSPVESIHRAREDMGLQRNVPTQGTNETQVNTAFSTYGISSYTSWNFDTILAHVRNGGSAVMAGNTRGVTWDVNVVDPNGVAHFLTVAGYDANTGEYLVVDPIAVQNTIKRTTSGVLYSYFDNDLGRAAVLI